MIIAIDYDDTYTRDPLMWNWFINSAEERGHTVWCVTARHENHLDDVEATIGRVLEPNRIVATNGQAKKKFISENYDFYVDVWIDDIPEAIVDFPLLKGPKE